jgi:hypothetical protein
MGVVGIADNSFFLDGSLACGHLGTGESNVKMVHT